MPIAPLLLALALSGAATSHPTDLRCVPLTRATDVALVVLPHNFRRSSFEVLDQRHGPVKGEQGRRYQAFMADENDWSIYNGFAVEFVVKRFDAPCLEVGWRLEPVGPQPIDENDLEWGATSGILRIRAHRGPPFTELYDQIGFDAVDDGRTEPNETFRLVLTDAHSGEALWGDGQPRPGGPRFLAEDGGPLAGTAGSLVMTICDTPRDGRVIARTDPCHLED